MAYSRALLYADGSTALVTCVAPSSERNGFAATALVDALARWSERCETDESAVKDAPEYPVLSINGPIHDQQTHAELNDITREEITEGMRNLWIVRWPRSRPPDVNRCGSVGDHHGVTGWASPRWHMRAVGWPPPSAIRASWTIG